MASLLNISLLTLLALKLILSVNKISFPANINCRKDRETNELIENSEKNHRLSFNLSLDFI